MEVLQEQLIAVVGTVLTVVVGYAVKQLKSYLDRKGIVDKLKVYESSAKIAVQAVEQIYHNEDGSAKFEKAKKHMAKELQQQGLPLEDDDLQYWIESAVAGMKQGWKQENTKDLLSEIKEVQGTATEAVSKADLAINLANERES